MGNLNPTFRHAWFQPIIFYCQSSSNRSYDHSKPNIYYVLSELHQNCTGVCYHFCFIVIYHRMVFAPKNSRQGTFGANKGTFGANGGRLALTGDVLR